jgi:glycosyltransferase involved in cell wall biosynthesis
MIYDLSVIIPARNEIFLSKTIESVLSSTSKRTEIITILDGQWSDPPIQDNPRVTIIYKGKSIGQRAAINQAVRISKAKYVMKLDAHCLLSENFDENILGIMQPDWTVVPRLYNLHAFDWMCKSCNDRTYQGPEPVKCEKCNNSNGFEMVMVWKPRWSRKTDSMRIDANLHFQYWGEYTLRPEAQGEISDTMSLLGACFLMERERYWELDGQDERHGSWGQQGCEVALKTWLSGGRLCVYKGAYYSHLFRTREGFSFPYPNPGGHLARRHSQQLWRSNSWPKAIHPLSWLVKRFWPVPGWSQSDLDELIALESASAKNHGTPTSVKKALTKGIVFYTENRVPKEIAQAVRDQLHRCMSGEHITAVSLKPLSYYENNIVLNLERGIMTMFKEILAGLEASKEDIIFLCEHDCLYPPEHFDFTPTIREAYHYNTHTYKTDYETGQSVYYLCRQVSGLCAFRETLITHYRTRISRMEENARQAIARGEEPKNGGHDRNCGYEPGNHPFPRGIDNLPIIDFRTQNPILDIRHGKNLTKSRWDTSEFRDKSTCQDFRLCDEVPFWGVTKGRIKQLIQDLIN